VPRIVIAGLTSLAGIGRYEEQLGNMAILIPMIRHLREAVPDAQIATTIQLTDKFCNAYGVERLCSSRQAQGVGWKRRLVGAVLDLVRMVLWHGCVSCLGVDFRFLTNGTKAGLLARDVDVVLDFNGDIFPTDVGPAGALIHALEMSAIRMMRVPILEFVSSPGPFDTRFRRTVGAMLLNRVALIMNREPISSELVRELGIRTPMVDTACPAFLLEPASAERIDEVVRDEKLMKPAGPLVGITVCGYNLHSARTWGRPTSLEDVKRFVPMVKYLLSETEASVFLLPHVYRTNPYTLAGEHINGPDHDILSRLYEEAGGNAYGDRLRVVHGKYTVEEAKGLIGRADLYISGRLHAGVAALSQCVPTVFIAYGHKHYGFAKLVRQEQYVTRGDDPERLRQVVEDAWENREKVRAELAERVPAVQRLARFSFEIVRDIVRIRGEAQKGIHPDLVNEWVSHAKGLLGEDGSA
jgi:colanic acid/amylovoran biosynthesis protein